MSYCVQCGKMVPEGTTLCQDCQAKNMPVQPVQPVAAVAVKQKPKIKKLWIILGAAAVVVVAVVLVLVALFRPRVLKIEDFQKVNGFTAYFHYGVPVETRVSDSGETLLDYEDKIQFYSITPEQFVVNPDSNGVTIAFDGGDMYDVYRKIEQHCDFVERTSVSYRYSYGDLDIFVYPGLDWVSLSFQE